MNRLPGNVIKIFPYYAKFIIFMPPKDSTTNKCTFIFRIASALKKCSMMFLLQEFFLCNYNPGITRYLKFCKFHQFVILINVLFFFLSTS